MARTRRKKAAGGSSTWLVTFTDMMTLMLTFFVLLVSMSVIDERRKLVVLGSIFGTFGIGEEGFDPRSRFDQRQNVEPGPLENLENLERIKDLVWDDLVEDVEFQENKYVQILSINADVLFTPGSTELSPRGRQVVDRMLPALLAMEHPLLLAGHTSVRREEFDDYDIRFDDDVLDFSWKLSFHRVMRLYTHLLRRGVSPEKLFVEAFGRFRPRESNETPAGRKANRRVDIVLDKRNASWIAMLERNPMEERRQDETFVYEDFEFQLTPPRREAAPNGGPDGGADGGPDGGPPQEGS